VSPQDTSIQVRALDLPKNRKAEMDQRVHSMFRDEMSSQTKPSLDGMAGEVLAKGRRARQADRTQDRVDRVAVGRAGERGDRGAHALRRRASRRRGRACGGEFHRFHAVRHADRAGRRGENRSRDRDRDQRDLVGRLHTPAGRGKAPTTSAAVLAELLKLLPPGKTSGYASFGLGAEVDYDGPSGLGMIRLSLYRGSLNPDACSSAVPADMTRT
jgi:hypothetical protein